MNSLQEIIDALRLARRVAVVTHSHPDGDALGSMLALVRLLDALGCPQVIPVIDEPVPRIYAWLPGADRLVTPKDFGDQADTLVLVDAARLERAGDAVVRLLDDDTRYVVIDHHLEDFPQGDVTIVDPSYAAAGEIVADLFDTAGVPFDRGTADCLYVAITTDTGGFRFENTSARTHRLAARLVEAGVETADVVGRVFDSMTMGRFAITRRILDRMEFLEGGRVALSFSYPKDFADTGAEREDLNNVINFGRNVEGVEVAVLLRDEGRGVTKISMRSNASFDCTEVAKAWGGGGHARAAGAVIPQPVGQARHTLMKEIRRCLANGLAR